KQRGSLGHRGLHGLSELLHLRSRLCGFGLGRRLLGLSCCSCGRLRLLLLSRLGGGGLLVLWLWGRHRVLVVIQIERDGRGLAAGSGLRLLLVCSSRLPLLRGGQLGCGGLRCILLLAAAARASLGAAGLVLGAAHVRGLLLLGAAAAAAAGL